MKIRKILIVLFITIIITGCNNKEISTNRLNEVTFNMKVIINSIEYTIDLEENETVKKFINLLPLELNMNELNGNEKYIYLDNSLPVDSYKIKHIEAGDIMLYGSDCLVIFYKSFDTSYSYTKIGHIDNLPNLGNGAIKVKFESQD